MQPLLKEQPLLDQVPGTSLANFKTQGSVMQQKAWSAKRERQYAHIKDSLLEGGTRESVAQEIAARVVNKERA
jgi:hypothetical protein